MDNETLGIEIATKLDWNGKDICEAFLAALTDANYHSLKKELELIVSKEFGDLFSNLDAVPINLRKL